jgi:hypothetical protein
LRSWSFISRIRGIPRGRPAGFEKGGQQPGRGGRGAAGLGEDDPPDAESGLDDRQLECIRLRFRRVMGKYEMSATKARGWAILPARCQQSPDMPD